MIKPAQIVVVVAGLALTLGLFYFGDLKVRNKPMTENAPHQDKDEHNAAFDFSLFKMESFAALPADQKQLMTGLEKKAEQTSDKAKKKELLNQLIAASEKNKLGAVGCMYSLQIAELENTAAAWTKTGDNFTITYSADTSHDGARQYLVNQAIVSYQKALEFDTASIDNKIRLATAYMDQGQEVMQGVQILLGIVRNDPDNVNANFILGRYGIISGQYDKAVMRLTKVVELDPKNVEAVLLLAEAHEALGQKEKAIEYYEKSKALKNDPNFSADVDAYIKKIKNS